MEAQATVGLGLLIRIKLRMLANRFDQTAREAPVKLITSLVFIGLIWIGLYLLFHGTLQVIRQRVLEGIVAVPLVFQFFFIALFVMLAFSNAIIAYSGLFGRGEASYLLAAPVEPLHIVTLRFFESLFFASWSLLLLGLPLMMAMARHADAPWPFYVLFMSFFLLFVPIPAAVGIVAAWAAARLFPRLRLWVLAWIVAVLLAAGVVFAYRMVHAAPVDGSQWIKSFFGQMAALQSALLPNQWVSEGIVAAAEGRYRASGFYLFVVGANALFLSWVAIAWVSRGMHTAYATAQMGLGHPLAALTGRGVLSRLAGVVFCYLPRSLRLLARKDMRCFLRDPVQWSQMVILLGLLGLYVSNVGQLGGGMGSADWVRLITFLNLTAVSLILATFTSRFVFPLISLEGQQFWLLGLLPLRRDRILWAKFAYATTITMAAGLLVTALSIRALRPPPGLAIAQVIVVAGVCVGLCGSAVGLGACWPMFTQRNPARIASGVGGTVNLILSVMLVVVTLVGVAMVGILGRSEERRTGEITAFFVTLVVAFNLGVAGLAMMAGIRRFRRMEL